MKKLIFFLILFSSPLQAQGIVQVRCGTLKATGSLVSPTKVLTALHVKRICEDREITIVYAPVPWVAPKIEVAGSWVSEVGIAEDGLALIKTAKRITLRPLKISTRTIQFGEKLHIIGFPLFVAVDEDSLLVYTDGVMAGWRHGLELTTAVMAIGMSGSPVLDEEGRMVGLGLNFLGEKMFPHDSQHLSGNRLGEYLPLRLVKDWLKGVL